MKLNCQLVGTLSDHLKRFFYTILTVSLISIICISCKKDIPAGETINANGFVIDTGGQQTFYGIEYNPQVYLDSAISDSNGNFSIQYTSEGKSAGYAIAIQVFI